LSWILITVRIQEPDFEILAGCLKKLWRDFDEILWVDIRGELDELITPIRFELDPDHSPDPGTGF